MGNKKSTNWESISKLMSLDIYLDGLSATEYDQISCKTHPLQNHRGPLLSWEYFLESYQESLSKVKRSRDLLEIGTLFKKYHLENDLEQLLVEDYEALVLTDSNLVIQWVNQGFTEMTGYSGKHALGKTPKFLQGANTSNEARKHIRKKIIANKPFRYSIINYRKSGEEYTCEIFIHPLHTLSGNTSHFLALEREVL